MRITLDEIAFDDILARRGVMIVGGSWADGQDAPVVELAPRRLLACGHPASCGGPDGCRACALLGVRATIRPEGEA